MGRAGFYESNFRSPETDRSAHHHGVLRSLSKLSVRGLFMVWCALESTTLCLVKPATGFAADVSMYKRREGSRMLSLIHGSRQNDVALYGAYPIPTGEVETFFTTMRLATNLSVGDRPVGEGGSGGEHGAQASSDMIGSLGHVIIKDNVKALMSMGDAWRKAFNEPHKNKSPHLEIVENSALTSKGHDAGSVKTCVHLLHSHRIWTVLTHITKDNINERTVS